MLPNADCQWSADTMTHFEIFSSDANQGEGTYEFTEWMLLFSKTYRRIIMMICSEKMLSSPNLLHCLLGNGSNLPVGAFDSDPDDQTPMLMK